MCPELIHVWALALQKRQVPHDEILPTAEWFVAHAEDFPVPAKFADQALGLRAGNVHEWTPGERAEYREIMKLAADAEAKIGQDLPALPGKVAEPVAPIVRHRTDFDAKKHLLHSSETVISDDEKAKFAETVKGRDGEAE